MLAARPGHPAGDRGLAGPTSAWRWSASGGLSHFFVDEELDRHVLDLLAKKDGDALGALPAAQLESGNSEIRNWIATAGAVEHLAMRLVDYVPCYRSEAGSGVGMAFAVWQ